MSEQRYLKLTQADKEWLGSSETFEQEIFEIINLFNVPVTNNEPYFDEENNTPVLHAAEFIESIKSAVERHKNYLGNRESE